MGQQRKDHREREPILRSSDRREGQWTKLQPLEMGERFQTAMRRGLAEPEPAVAQRLLVARLCLRFARRLMDSGASGARPRGGPISAALAWARFRATRHLLEIGL